jgi:hypothetical protein
MVYRVVKQYVQGIMTRKNSVWERYAILRKYLQSAVVRKVK